MQFPFEVRSGVEEVAHVTEQASKIITKAQVPKSSTDTPTIDTQDISVFYLSLTNNPLAPIFFMSATYLLLMSLLQLLCFSSTSKINFHTLNFDEESLEINHKQS